MTAFPRLMKGLGERRGDRHSRGGWVRAISGADRMLLLAGRGAWRTRGKHVRPTGRGQVRWARGSTGRRYLIARDGTGVSQLSGR